VTERSLAEQFESLEKQSEAGRLGMWLFLASEVLLFTGLFTLYAAYRAMYPHDFAAGVEHDNVVIGTTNTAILITSSFTVVMALDEVRRSRPRRAAGYLLVSLGLGLVFLFLKSLEYAEHFRVGIYPGASYSFAELSTFGAQTFFTLYYFTTALHGLHVVAGMCVLGWLAVGCWRGQYSAERQIRVELGALYWHLVDVFWIFLWPLFYLMRD
jgi:cytochrome c oxidase subunit 3